MYDLARSGFSSEALLKALKSNRTVSYMFELLDKNDVPMGFVSASGNISFDSQARIKRAAALTINEAKDIDFLNDRIRPYMALKLSEGTVKFPLGVFLMASPSRKAESGRLYRDVDCYDKTQILVDDRFTTRYLIAKGTNYVAAIGTILQSAGITNYYIDVSELITAQPIEFEIGTAKLDAINKLLQAINYNDLYVDSLGNFRASEYHAPESRMVERAYMTDKASIVLDGASYQLDAYNVPNKVVRYLENAERDVIISEAVNADPASALSTVSRGRTIVDVDAVYDIADKATLDAYTARVMAEMKVYQTVAFQTAVMPGHEFLDCLYIENKDLNISGKYIETSWNIDLRNGGRMSHVCKKAVSI